MNSLRTDIEDAYSRRDRIKGDRYGWWQPDVINQQVIRDMALRRFLHHAFAGDLSNLDVLDAGCGHGGLLRSLIECGADPSRMIGVDMLRNRIDDARRRSPSDLRFEIGDATEVDAGRTFDLVTAFTVLSSIKPDARRAGVLRALQNRVRPGGWLLVFDFRFNNPRNSDVSGVKPRWIKDQADPGEIHLKTMFSPPPIARRLAPIHPVLYRCFAAIARPFRSHFLLGIGKPSPSLDEESLRSRVQ
jgi:SAM-dependent methyltransferase